MNKYKLIKVSFPGWREDFDTISHVLDRLLPCICNMCMINNYDDMKNALEKHGTEVTAEDINTELECCCISEDYESFNDEDKVYALLSTDCGCEYMLEEDLECILI